MIQRRARERGGEAVMESAGAVVISDTTTVLSGYAPEGGFVAEA